MDSGPPDSWMLSLTAWALEDIMVDRSRPYAFLAAPRARAAHRLIGSAEELVTALGNTPAHLVPARTALDAAKALYAAREYSGAAAQARRANALAMSLNERFAAYMEAWKALHEAMQGLERLGFPTDSVEAALSAADKETVHLVEEEGTLVPNYNGAAVLLRRASDRARTLVASASEVSREIFLATLATEALSEGGTSQGSSWLAVHLEERLARATHELALGNVPASLKIATETRIQAEDALAGGARVEEILTMVGAILEGLRAEGPLAECLVEKVGAARLAFEHGFLDWTTASVVAHQLSDDVAAFAKRFPGARQSLERSEASYAALQQEGFSSYEVERCLTEARLALGAGDWTTVQGRVHRASQAVMRLRNEQQSLRHSLEDLDDRVSLLSGFHLPLLPDIQEILVRTKEEIRCGRLSGAQEDLLLAGNLLRETTRAGS